MTTARTALPLFAVITGLVLSGCGREPGVQTDGEAITGVLSSFGDQASNPKTLKVYFADGKAPGDKELIRFKNKSFELVDEPTSAGDAVTAKVKVYDEMSGDELGVVEWKFVKVGEQWKLDSAPLPG